MRAGLPVAGQNRIFNETQQISLATLNDSDTVHLIQSSKENTVHIHEETIKTATAACSLVKQKLSMPWFAEQYLPIFFDETSQSTASLPTKEFL